MPASPMPRALILGAAAVLVTSVAITPPASAAAASRVAAPNGLVGIPANVWVNAPKQGSSVPVVFSQSGVPSITLNAALNAQGQGTVSWTPPTSGSWTISAGGASDTAVVSPMPTRTVLTAPVTPLTIPTGTLGTQTVLTMTVTALGGQIAPTGSVTVTGIIGGNLGTAPLTPIAGTASSTASLLWSPPQATNYPLTATYNPGPNSGMLPSNSAQINPLAASAPLPTVVMRVPSTFTAGVATNIGVTVASGNTSGSVAFNTNVNGTVTYIGGSVAVAGGGTATQQWTPVTPGNQLLNVEYTATDLSNGQFITATATQWIFVNPDPPADGITITAPGVGVLTSATRIQSGTSLALNAVSTSGASVAVNAQGACAIDGNTLITTATSGTCTLSAYSPGTTSFDPATVSTSVTVVAPPKKPRKPKRPRSAAN